MRLPGTNFDGFLVLAGSFGVALGIQSFATVKNDGLLTVLMGVVVAASGFVLRHQVDPEDTSQVLPGPKVFWLPVWVLGVFWVGLGIAKWVGLVA